MKKVKQFFNDIEKTYWDDSRARKLYYYGLFISFVFGFFVAMAI